MYVCIVGGHPTDADTLGRQQPGENPYSIPGTELPPDEPPPPYDAINKDRIILAWDGNTVTPVTQYIPLQTALSSSNNYTPQDNNVTAGSANQMTQTPLRRSQRRGSSNRLIDRNSRPSSARSSQRRPSNSQILDNDGGSPNLTRHRRHGSSGQILDPGTLQRRGSRERVVDGDRRSVQQGGVPSMPSRGAAEPPSAMPHRVQGHQRRGSDSQLIDNRAPHFNGDLPSQQTHVRVPLTNLSIDSSTQRLEPNMNSANYYSPPSEISSAYEQMSTSVVNMSQQPRRVLPPMPNRQQNHLPQSVEHPLHVNTHHQRASDRTYPYHQVSPNPPSVHQHHSPIEGNSGQLSPRQIDTRDPSFQAQQPSPRMVNPAEELRNRQLRFPRTNPQLPLRSSPPQSISPREPYQHQQQSFGLALRPTSQPHSPTLPTQPLLSPPIEVGPPSPMEHGPNQALEILPTGSATQIWGLDSTTV